MLIKTKYIDCASKSVFNTWKLPTSAADTSGDIYWSAIVYIQDTGEVWTHGKLYGGFFSNADSNKVSLTIGGTTKILALDGHVQSYTTLTGSGTTANQAILSTGVANKWTLKTLGKNAFSNVDYLPADATAVAAKKVVNAMTFQYNGKDIHSFDGSAARLLNIIQGNNVFITGDNQGNVTIAADPGSDTVNTAGATNLINKKLFLIGAESQTTSPQTYSNQYVYIGTDNCLYSLGRKVLTEHQAIYNLDLQTQVRNAVTKVTTFDPNSANNSFTLVQGTNVTLIPDATNKKVTISSKDTTYDFYNLIFKQGDTVVDTYKPTTSPNKSFKAGTNVTFTKSGDEITVTTQDTRNTAGATEKLATKLFLTGSLTQTDNPQTYTNSKVYIGTDNKLYSDGKKVSTTDHTHPIYVTLDTKQTINGSKTFTTPIISTVASGTAPFRVASNTLVTNLNADRLDNLHENSFLRYRDTVTTQVNTLWAQIGIRQYNKALPDGLEESNTYNYGSVISLPGNDSRLDIWYNHHSSDAEYKSNGIQYRTGWGDGKMPWRTLLDTVNYPSYADSHYVTIATDQAVTGTKTFSKYIKFSNSWEAAGLMGSGDISLGASNRNLVYLNTTEFRPHRAETNKIALGNASGYWKSVTSGQFISKVGSGTAPLVVASNTLVSNLNADLLDGLHAKSFIFYKEEDFDPATYDGYYMGMTTKSGINTNWWHIISMNWGGSNMGIVGSKTWVTQLALPTQDRRGLKYRTGNSTSYGSWVDILDVTNYAGTLDGRYLKKAGDTMTGTLGMGANTIYWRESGFGDKFGLTPYFSGTDNSNYLAFMSSVGAAGTDPTMTAKMVLTGLGNVGIGTTTPTQKLHVIGGGLFTALLTTTGITNNGTLTQNGDIIINQASTTGTRQVRFQGGDNDYGRVAYGGTAFNAGWIEIASGDDGNEPIYARQYTGAFTTVKRTATLLDANGNTVFPGTVTAPTFTGALNGTAEWSKRLATNSQLTFGLNGLTYFNANLGAGTAANQNVGPTAQWWHILRMNHGNSSGYFADIAVPLSTSDGIYWRRIQRGTNYGWYRVLDTNNYAGIIDGRYVNVTGDTMTGALHLANGTRNNAGNDCGFGDCNIGGCLGLQGLNGATGLAFIQQGASWSGGNNYRFTWNGSNMTSSSTAQWNNLNADLLDGYHQAAFSMGWTTSTKYRVDRWGGSTDKNWKKIVTYVCTDGGQYRSCKVKGTIYYIIGNHNQGHVVDIPFEAIMYAYGGTANSMLNQSYLYLPPYCTWDMIRIVRYNNNSWEVQVRQPSNWTNISLEYTVTNNGGSVSAGQFINTSYSSTVANNYNTNVSRPTSSYANRAASADRLTTARSINGTSFNGTANITTSYWGTARNFTIGNTTRSVNGSGNVSWSFADIGGAPANHSHNYINSRGNLNPQTGRTQNLGNVYSYNTVSGTSNGAPAAYTSVIGFGRSTRGTVEIAGGWTAGMGLWYRALRDTTDNWYGWVKVWDTKNFDPNSKANSNHNHNGLYITKGGSNNNVVLGAGGYRALSDFTLNSNWAASKDISGYVKFPNGFIIQWGEAYVGANSRGYKTFPIAFPTACISVQVTHKTTATNWDKVCVVGNYTRTSCTIANCETVNSMINWMALGY